MKIHQMLYYQKYNQKLMNTFPHHKVHIMKKEVQVILYEHIDG